MLPVPFPFHLSGHDEAADTLRRGAEKFSETGRTPQSPSPTPEGSVCHGQLSFHLGCQKLLQTDEGWGGSSQYAITKRTPLSLSGGAPPHTPTRFAMPATRGKTSLNARDWRKGKKLLI